MIIRLILLALLTTGFAGCDFLYSLLHKEGAEEKQLVGEFVPYEKNSTIEEIQLLLKIYGYAPGKADGVMGIRTRDAVARFQKDNGLEVTRFVDEKTWEKLREFEENQLIKGGEINIILVQTILKQVNLDPGKVDGKFGPKTKAAIMEFQRQKALKADGKIGYKTLQELAQYLPPKEGTPSSP